MIKQRLLGQLKEAIERNDFRQAMLTQTKVNRKWFAVQISFRTERADFLVRQFVRRKHRYLAAPFCLGHVHDSDSVRERLDFGCMVKQGPSVNRNQTLRRIQTRVLADSSIVE